MSLVQPLVVSFFQDSTAEPLSEGAFDTDREDVIVMCREADWGFVQKLQRGDVIERTSGKRYAVQKVQESSMMGYVIKARETE